MSPAELSEAVETCHVFAKLDPMQKEAIGAALRARGHVVGFMGDGINDAALSQTGWFIESLLSQTLIVHVIRTDRIPFLQSRSSLALGMTTLAICAVGVWLPFSPLAASFGLVVPPVHYWGLIALVIFAYMCLAQIVKTWVVRRIAATS